MLLGHQAGLPVIRDPLPEDGYCDGDLVVDLLATQAPVWEPGTAHGYHALSFGHLVGEVVRRIIGQSLGRFFRDELADPLGLDFWIGLPAEYEARVAPTISVERGPSDPVPEFIAAAMKDPTSIPGLLLFNSGRLLFRGPSTRTTGTRSVHRQPYRVSRLASLNQSAITVVASKIRTPNADSEWLDDYRRW
jgi:CubicO group peptidase (beta-lactamase class C family)